MKVAVNARYGGFRLSDEAEARYKELSGKEWNDSRSLRWDPIIIQVIEELGNEKVSSRGSKIEIVDLPKGTQFYIHEYDGFETIVTIDDISWSVAT